MQPLTILHAGTEFRRVDHLEQVFKHHEDWDEIKQIISEGCDYKLSEEVDEEARLNDL